MAKSVKRLGRRPKITKKVMRTSHNKLLEEAKDRRKLKKFKRRMKVNNEEYLRDILSRKNGKV